MGRSLGPRQHIEITKAIENRNEEKYEINKSKKGRLAWKKLRIFFTRSH
jgi:hypothetical protein